VLTLSLFRHAKSSWDDPRLEDFDRPLAERGIDAAPKMGAYMAREGIRPDIVLSSSSQRTRQTVAHALPAFGQNQPPVTYEDDLYLASASTLLSRIRRADARAAERGARHIMLVGHDPGFHSLALLLTGKGEKDDVATLARKFPTAAVAVLDFECDRWADVKEGAGRLRRFMTPRMLP
jgi:phosphohistidine phosphatase